MSRVMIRWILLITILAGLERASAHAGFESETEVRIFADRMDICVRSTLGFGWKMMGDHAPVDAGEAGRETAKPVLTKIAPGLFDVSAAGSVMKPRKVNCVFELDQHIALLLTYDRPAGWPLVFTARFLDHLGPLDSGTIRIFDQTDTPFERDIEPDAGKILFHSDPSLVFSLAPPPAAGDKVAPPPPELTAPSLGGYFVLGIHHIVTGFDHLLFLLALLLGCRALRTMWIVVTAFTVAHSITLALAVSGRVELPDRWVESMIAFSIIWVAVGNLRGRTGEEKLGWLTFGFGLVHGLGFAGVLRHIGLGAGGQSIVPPLLLFNLGVEAGQLGVLAFVMPVLITISQHPFYPRYANPTLSILVIVAGAVWLFQRVFT